MGDKLTTTPHIPELHIFFFLMAFNHMQDKENFSWPSLHRVFQPNNSTNKLNCYSKSCSGILGKSSSLHPI
jgi:hypothetical protein